MRVRGLGLDVFNNGEMERNGGWGTGDGKEGTASAAIFGPVTGSNVIGVLFVNSNIPGGPNSGRNVRAVLEKAYNDSVKPK